MTPPLPLSSTTPVRVSKTPTTIRDVAKASGVSAATVSFVLNNGPRPVNAQTRERVLATMRRLNYHPNAVARSLTRRNLHTIGVLFSGMNPRIVHNTYAAAVLDGLFAAASDAGYNLTLFTAKWENAADSARAYGDGRTDGVIVVNPLVGSDIVDGLADLGLPVLALSAPSHRPDVPYVDVDNREGMRLVAQHLVDLGHTRMVHVCGAAHHFHASERRDAFLTALRDLGIDTPPEYVLTPASHEPFSALWTRLRGLLARPDGPTAVFAHNDHAALALLRLARESGVAIPEQFSLVGFDDVADAAVSDPPLTTVAQPYLEMGAVAVRLMVERIENGSAVSDAPGEAAPVFRATPHLIVRATTCPPFSVSTKGNL